jgi:hypothetical protein
MRTIFTFLFLACTYALIAQNASYNNSAAPVSYRPPTYVRDIFSTHIDPKPYAGIDGSPFFDDNWLLARIKVLGKTETYDSILIRLNIYNNTVHFKDENGEELQMTEKVEAIKIIDSSSAWNNTVFLSNFSQEPGFYQVLEDGGKLKLLKRLRVLIWESQPLNSALVKKFEVQGDLFLSFTTTLYKASKACSAIRDAFTNNDKMFEFISNNNLKCNKQEDLQKIVQFYATLK